MRFFIAVLQLSIILCYDTLKILKSGLDRGPIIKLLSDTPISPASSIPLLYHKTLINTAFTRVLDEVYSIKLWTLAGTFLWI